MTVEDEVFYDECGTYWLLKCGRTRNQARRAIATLERLPYKDLGCRSVRGTVGEKHGETNWLTVHEDGAEEFWEVYEV